MQSNLPFTTFLELLWKRDRELYTKYNLASHGWDVHYTAQEKDVLFCIGVQARKLTETK